VWQAHLELKQQINAAQLLQQVCNCSRAAYNQLRAGKLALEHRIRQWLVHV